MKHASTLGGSLLVLAVFVGGCSSTTIVSNTDGGSSGSGAGAGLGGIFGGSGGADGGTAPTASCAAAAGDNACATCLKKNCCSQFTACVNDQTCGTALNTCTTEACIQANANANALLTCADTPCGQACDTTSTTPTAGTAKVGDPCVSNDQCLTGLECAGSWCSKTCTSNQDCGSNSSGTTNACEASANGLSICYPGCSQSNGCAAFASAHCVQGPSGDQVCSL